MTKIATYLTLFTTALLAVSCSSDDIDMPAVPDGGNVSIDYMAGFTITLDSGEGASLQDSRAPSDGDYEAGTVSENYIDIEGEDFKILFFDKNNGYLGALNDVHVIIESSDGSMKRYRVSGTVSSDVVGEGDNGFKMMMLANWHHNYPKLERGTSIAAVASSSGAAYAFDYTLHQNVGQRYPIPMFGITDLITGKEFVPGWNTDLGTLHMLRAYAKVRVRAASDGLPLASVTLTRGNIAGLRAPVGVDEQADYVHASYAKDYYRIPSVPLGSGVQTDIPFVYNKISGEWILYLPEFTNLVVGSDGRPDPRSPLDENTRTRLKVTFDGHVGDVYVDFKYYNTPPAYAGPDARIDNYFDILRNTVYDYTLRKLIGDADITVEVDVQPYAEQVLKPGFGLLRDEMGDFMIRPEKDVNGNDSLPTYFIDYLKATGKDTVFDKFPLDGLVEGDYYAIHRIQDGEMVNAEIWLKDIDGAHVIENFRPKDDNDENCSTRYVEMFFGLDKNSYYKDAYGDRRLHHFVNHWSVVLDRNDYTVFKSPDNTVKYEVESFDSSSPELFYIVANPREDDTHYFFIEVRNGVITDTKVAVPKNE